MYKLLHNLYVKYKTKELLFYIKGGIKKGVLCSPIIKVISSIRMKLQKDFKGVIRDGTSLWTGFVCR